MVYKNMRLGDDTIDIKSENGIIIQIGKIDEHGVDLEGRRVYPGLVDIHTHGIVGIDTMDAEFGEMARAWAQNGTTTVYPTTMTAPHDKLMRVLTARIPKEGAKIRGIHLEGPYINPKYVGAQNKEDVREPDIDEFKNCTRAKLITLAPEREGSWDYIKNTDMTVCIGHTGADYYCGCRAAEAGARCVTHIFNAMPPLHHRRPSVVGAAFDKDMYVQVICDGKHIHPSVIRMLYKLFGAERMILISDSMRATGLCDGDYEFGGLHVTVKDSVARTDDGSLAGSTSTLFECVQYAVKFGIPEADAYRMASQTPAELMGIKAGKICEGYDCDLIVLNEDDTIHKVIINGRIYE